MSNWELIWTAASAIGTLLAIVAALFITKWEEIINNRKKLKICWYHIKKTSAIRLTLSKFSTENQFDEIEVKFVNVGNRKIILEGVSIEFESKDQNALTPEFIYHGGIKPDMTFPHSLDTEETAHFYIPSMNFAYTVKKFINDKKIKQTDNLKVIAVDTTGKTYGYNTGIKFEAYLNILPEN